MGKSTRRKRKERRRKALGAGILAAVVVLTLAVGGYVAQRHYRSVSLDPETMCPADRMPSAHVAVLIDASDPLNPVQREFVAKYLRSLRDEIPQYGKFALYVLQDPERQVVDPVLSLCNPGDGRDASFIDENPRQIRARWRQGFAEPLEQAIGRTLDAPPSGTSPIAEMIAAVAVDAFPVGPGAPRSAASAASAGYGATGGGEGGSGRSAARRLIVVSDLLQNSEKLSHYGRRAAELPDLAGSEAVEPLIADLSGVEVTALYLSRAEGAGERLQGRDHVRHWETLLDRCGALLMEVQRVPG